MANFKYFAELNGETVHLSNIWHNGGASNKASSFIGVTPAGVKMHAERKVEYKQFASKHECDDRCVNATGLVMKCECACGGKNHGKGSFTRKVTF